MQPSVIQQLEPRELLTVFGNEVVANSTRVLNQIDSATATTPDGRSVVVWVHLASPTNADIRAQLFDAQGAKDGPEVQVASSRKSELKPSVAMDALGNFVVSWQVLETTRVVDVVYYGLTKQRLPVPVFPPPSDPPPRNVIDVTAQRFDARGVPIGSLLTVANSNVDEFDPSVAMSALGAFVVSYTVQTSTTNQDIRARLFASNGSVQRDVVVASDPNRNEQHSTTARTPDGRFVVAYDSTRRNAVDSDVWLARFTAFGNLQSTEAVSATSNSDDERPAVSVDNNGNATVVWEHFRSTTNRDIYARTMKAIGASSSILTVSASLFDEDLPAVAMHPTDGTAVVAFVSNNTRVRVAELSRAGVVDQVADFAADSFAPSVSMQADGRYFVSYDRLISASRDVLLRRGRFGPGGTMTN